MSTLKIFGEADERTIQQAENCLAVEEDSRGVLCADNHLGYAQPVGMAIAYRDHISVSGVGYDIGCGNKAVLTNLRYSDLHGGVPAIMKEITDKISFQIGPNRGQRAPDHPVIDEIANAHVIEQRALVDKACDQLSTVGAGNHYVDLFEDDDERIWVGVHFGSRGFGHTTATGFLNFAAGRAWDESASKGEKESVMDKPVVLETGSNLGELYIEAMQLCGRYAYAGRDIVCDRVLDILGASEVSSVHNHHNFAWRENHFGEDLWVIRKGCTPAFPGQQGFVGATMGEDSVILEGASTPDTQTDCPRFHEQREALFSTVHGAGRAMSRTEAAGKKRKRWSCQNRDCDWVQPPRTHKPPDGACPVCGTAGLKKRWIQEREGKINWSEANEDLAEKGIVLRGGAADEAPGAYKRLTEVLAFQGETINVLTTLHPIGVAMAGPDVNDPFKD